MFLILPICLALVTRVLLMFTGSSPNLKKKISLRDRKLHLGTGLTDKATYYQTAITSYREKQQVLKRKSNSQETRVEFQTAIIHELQCCLHCRIILISSKASYLLLSITIHILPISAWMHLDDIAFRHRCYIYTQVPLILVLKIKATLLPTTLCGSHEQQVICPKVKTHITDLSVTA